jgi:hypothetical protein
LQPERWVRFHSLPDAKRYAEDDAERRELLRRQSALGDFALGRDADCVVFTHCFRIDNEPSGRLEMDVAGLPSLDFARRWTVPCPEEPDLDLVCAAAGETVRWDPEQLAAAMGTAAVDASRWLLLSLRTRQVFAPYDGGVDLFLASPERVRKAKACFGGWLSPHPSGL